MLINLKWMKMLQNETESNKNDKLTVCVRAIMKTSSLYIPHYHRFQGAIVVFPSCPPLTLPFNMQNSGNYAFPVSSSILRPQMNTALEVH